MTRISERNETWAELLVGIMLTTLFIEVLGIILAPSKLSFCLSVLIGTICSVLTVTHMTVTIERELDMPGEDAVKYARRSSILRFVFMLLVLLCSIYIPSLHIIGVFLGWITLKIAVYIRPFVKKYILKKFLSKGR